MAALWWFGVMALGPATAFAEHLLYGFHPAPEWVAPSPVEYETSPPSGADVTASWILLLDRQVNVLRDGDDQYEHVAVKVLNSTGAEQASQFNVVIDPTFQTLTVHSLQIVRAGVVMDARKSARITALPQETELRERIYNGHYNINVLLADVRVGDVVEYSYTLHSQEKLFPGHYAARMSVGSGNMVHRERVRVSWPAGRDIEYRLGGAAQTTSPRLLSTASELTLEWQDLKPTVMDEDAPGWYEQWPYVELSDFQSWSDVASLVLPLFVQQVRSGSGDRVRAVVEEIEARGGSADQQLLHAVQYVQDQVQYASISIGRGSYMPSQPEEVLKRNFGDCKDKALLLATILRQLGVEAVPALVNSQRGKTLPDDLPSPYVFDHAIVRFEFHGQNIWVDPTLPKRYSLLSPRDPPDYESALLLARPNSGLYNIPRPAFDAQRRYVTKMFDLSAGIDKPATLVMLDSYTGSLADNLRSLFAGMDHAQFELSLRNELARFYPDASLLAPIAVNDHPESNLVEVQARYKLEHSFVKNRDGNEEFTVHAQELYSLAEPLDSSVRRSPLAVEFPFQIHEHIAVLLPGEWPVQPDVVEVRNPAFLYRSRVNYGNGRLDIDYDYTALADHVELSALKQYQEDRRRLFEDLGYRLSKDPRVEARGYAIAPVPLLVLVAALLGGGWLAARWAYRYDPRPMTVTDEGAPVGLGGWLALLSLGVCVAPLISLWVMSIWCRYVEANVWDGLSMVASSGYRGWVHPVTLAIIALSSFDLIGHILLLNLFFKRRTSAPALLVILQWLGIALGWGVVIFFNASGLYKQPVPTPNVLADGFWSVFWTIYMFRSQRVRATFTRRLKQTGVDAGPDLLHYDTVTEPGAESR